jgi:hypothetical protein
MYISDSKYHPRPNRIHVGAVDLLIPSLFARTALEVSAGIHGEAPVPKLAPFRFCRAAPSWDEIKLERAHQSHPWTIGGETSPLCDECQFECCIGVKSNPAPPNFRWRTSFQHFHGRHRQARAGESGNDWPNTTRHQPTVRLDLLAGRQQADAAALGIRGTEVSSDIAEAATSQSLVDAYEGPRRKGEAASKWFPAPAI